MFSLWLIHITQAVCLTCSLFLLPSEFTLNPGSLSKQSLKRLYVLVHQFHNGVFVQLHRYTYTYLTLTLWLCSPLLRSLAALTTDVCSSVCHGLLQPLLCVSWKNKIMSCKSRVWLCPEQFLWVQFGDHFEYLLMRADLPWRIYLEGNKLKLQGASLAQAPSRAVGWALNKYSLSYLTLYLQFYIVFLKEGPKNFMSFRPQKNLSPPLLLIVYWKNYYTYHEFWAAESYNTTS